MSVSSKMDFSGDSLRINFERALEDAATKGKLPPSDIGLDYEVDKAIRNVALAFPDAQQWEQVAREAFEEQLRG